MQRDWDIIRKILLKIEDLPTEDGTFSSSDLVEFDSGLVAHQMRLMIEAGLIEGGCRNGTGAAWCHASRLTWQGHEFLDSVRNETVWRELKKQAKTKAIDLPIGVIISLAKELIEKLIFDKTFLVGVCFRHQSRL